jgi:nucleotide-binding universal stress UspA family protein
MTTDTTEPTSLLPSEQEISADSIVVATDGSDDADRAVRWAAEQAFAERRPLVVVTTLGAPELPAVSWSGMGTAYSVHPGDLIEAGKAVAEKATAIALHLRPGLEATSIVRVGDPRYILEQLSRRAHLVVLGSRGRGALRSKLLGSVSTAVSRDASCPVVVCRPSPRTDRPGRGILVGADGTPESIPVIEFAFQQAALHGMPLTVVHSLWDSDHPYRAPELVSQDEPGLEEHRLLLAESVAGMCSKFPEVVVHQRLAHGLAESVLSHESKNWDLIVVGRHPVDSLLRLLTGAVATSVVERARTNVAIVPQAEPHAEG